MSEPGRIRPEAGGDAAWLFGTIAAFFDQNMLINTLSNRALIAVALALLVVLLVRKRVPVWAFIGLLIAGVLGVVFATPDVSLWGFHGQMHWAFSLATLRSTPPEDPIFAGEGLMYPWVAHWFYGQASRATGPAPTVIIGMTDVVWLAMMIGAAAWGAMLLTRDRGAAVVAAFLAWGGLLLTDNAYIAQIGKLNEAIKPCMRMVPADKFFQPNNNPIGLALSAVAILCLVRLNVARPANQPRSMGWLIALFGASLACAVLYPISMVGIVAALFGGAAGYLIARRALFDTDLFLSGVAVGLAGLVALPLMLAFDRGKGEYAQVIATPMSLLGSRLAVLAAVGWAGALAMLIAFIVWRRAQRQSPSDLLMPHTAWVMLVGTVVGLAGAYVVLTIPRSCEYKFLAQTAAPLACLVAPWLAGMIRKRWWVGAPVLAIFVLGAADRQLVRFDLQSPSPIVWHDDRWHSRDAALDGLLTYIRERTPENAVVLAEEPLVPTVGERSLYLLPLSIGKAAGDGWSMGRYRLTLEVIGHPTAQMMDRQSRQAVVLGAGDDAAVAEATRTLRQEFGDRPVYALVSSSGERRAIDGSAEWMQVFETKAGRVLMLVPAGSAASPGVLSPGR